MAETNNQNVDTRIVEAKFDSSDFEKGVNKTVKKLDELKKSLNLKETGKSIAEISEETKKATNSAAESVDNLNKRLTTFTGIVKNQILSGLASEVSGVFLRMEQSVISLARTLGSQQISVGMNKYTSILGSVRTMMVNGFSQDASYEAVERLRDYSDQTSYSLDQLVDTVSKFTAAGADLKTATKLIEGLSNAAASMGVNTQEASRIYLNFSQAYTSGKMQNRDWVSFESANMASKPFIEQILEAGVRSGSLKKNKQGHYSIAKGKGKGKKVTIDNFKDMLRYDWFDRKTMNELGDAYWWEDLTANMSELSKEMKGTAGEAFEAAKEARSFTDVLNTLKDVISTGWSTSFEYIFGKLDEAAKFFTWLSESNLANAIYSIGEFRNTMLDAWKYDKGQESFVETLKTTDNILGLLHEQFGKIFDDPITLGRKLSRATKSVEQFVKQVEEWLTATGADGVQRIDKIGETIQNVANIVSDAYGIVKTVIEFLGTTAGNVLEHIFGSELEDGTQKVSNAESALNEFNNILVTIHGVTQKIEEPLGKILGIIGTIAEFLLEMGIDAFIMDLQFFADIIGVIVEAFGGTSGQELREGKGVLQEIGEAIESLKNTCKEALGSVSEFFKAIIADLKRLFGLEVDENQNGSVFSNLESYFQNNEFLKKTKEWLDTAVADITKWFKEFPDRITKAVGNLGDFIYSLFYTKQTVFGVDKDGNDTFREIEVATPLKRWIDKAIADVKKFIKSIPSKIKKVGSVISAFWHSLFYKKKLVAIGKDKNGHALYKAVEVETELKKWLDSILESVKNFIKNLPEHINNAIKGAGSLLRTIVGAIFGKKDGKEVTNKDVEDELAKPFEGLTLSGVIETIKSIGSTILNEILSLFTGTTDVETNKNFLANSVANGINWIKEKADKAWEEVKKWFKNLPNKIAELFTDKDTGETSPIGIALSNFARGIGKRIEEIPGLLEDAFKAAEVLIRGLWSNLYETVTGKKSGFALKDPLKSLKNKIVDKKRAYQGLDVTDADTSDREPNAFKEIVDVLQVWANQIDFEGIKTTISEKIVELGDALKKFITEDLPNKITEAGTWLSENATTLWTKIDAWLKEPDEDGVARITQIQNSVIGIGEKIYDAVTKELPKKISEAYEWLKAQGLNIWTGFNAWLDEDIEGETRRQKIEAKVAEIGNTIKEAILGKDVWADLPMLDNSGGEKKVLLGHIPGLVDNIYNAITVDLPKAFSDAWAWLSEHASNIWAGFNAWLDEEDEGGSRRKKISDKITEIGTSIKDFITVILPAKISEAWTWLLDQGKNIWTGFNAWLDEEGEDGSTRRQRIANKITEIGQNIFDFITITLPAKISEAWTWLLDQGKNIWTGFNAWLDEEGEDGSTRRQRIVNKITEIGTSIKDFITVILPAKISEAWTWLLDQGKTIWTGFNAWLDEEGEDGSTRRQRIVNKITEIGQNIFDFITVTIPAKIGQAWDWLVGQGKTIWTGFNTWLDETDENGDARRDRIKKKIIDIGDTIYNAITEDLPEKIRSAFEYLSNIFSGGSGSGAERMFREKPAFAKKAEHPVLQAFGNLINNVKRFIDEKGPIIWDTVKAIFSSIGPPILDGINTALEWLGKGFENVTKFFNERDKNEPLGDSIKDKLFTDADEKEQPALVKSITQLGQTIWHLLTTIIPNFITAAFSEIQTIFSHGLQELFGGSDSTEKDIDKTKENIEGAEVLVESYSQLQDMSDEIRKKTPFLSDNGSPGIKVANGAAGMLEGIINFLSMPTVQDSGRLILICATLMVLANSVSNMFEAVDVMGETGYAIKWSAIRIAFVGIIAMLAYIAWLGQQDDTVITNSERLFDKLISFVTTMTRMVGTLSVGKGFFSTLTSIFGKDKTVNPNVFDTHTKLGKTGNLLVNGLTDFVGGIVGGLGKTLGIIGGAELAAGAVGDVTKEYASIFSEIGIRLNSLIDWISEAGSRAEGLADKVDALDSVFGSFINLLKTIGTIRSYSDDVDDAIDIVNQFVTPLELFKTAVSGENIKAYEITNAIDRLLGMRKQMKEFGKFVTSDEFTNFKYGLSTLGSALSLYSKDSFTNVNVEDDSSLEGAIDILEKIFGNERLKGLADLLNDSTIPDSKDVFGKMEALTILAASLKTMSNSSEGLNEESGKRIQDFFEAINAIEMAKDQTAMNQLRESLGTIGVGLEAFSKGISGLNEENIKSAEQALSMLTRIAHAIPREDTSAFTIFFGDKGLDTFGTKIASLGQSLASFFHEIDYIKNADGTETAVTHSLDNIYAAGQILRAASTAANYLRGTDVTVDKLSNLGGVLGDLATGINSYVTTLTADKILDASELDYVYKISGFLESLAVMAQTVNNLEGVYFGNTFKERLSRFNNDVLGTAERTGLIDTIRDVLGKIGSLANDIKNHSGYWLSDTDVTLDEIMRTTDVLSRLFTSIGTMNRGLIGMEYVPATWSDVIDMLNNLTADRSKIKEFLAVTAEFDQGGLEKAALFFEGIANLAQALRTMGNIYDTGEIYNGIANLERMGPLLETANIGEKLITAVSNSFNDESNKDLLAEFATSVAKDFAAAIQAAFDSDDSTLHPQISPVLNAGSLETMKQQIKDAIGVSNGMVSGIIFTPDWSGLSSALNIKDPIDYRTNLNEINDTVADLKKNINDVAESIAGLGITIDGNLLVGYIDERMGYRGFRYSRNGPTEQ